MQINIGDTVRFLNEIGGGEVIQIVDAKTVVVLNEDEFDIPCLKTDLVVVNSKQSSDTEEQTKAPQESKEIIKKISHQETEDIYTAFVPKDGYKANESPLEVYLINDTDSIILYTYNKELNDGIEGVAAGILDPRSKISLEEYDQKSLANLKSCIFQIIFYKNSKTKIKACLEKTIRINPVKFYKNTSYNENDYFNEEVILEKLTGQNFSEQVSNISQSEVKNALSQKRAGLVVKHKLPNIDPKNTVLEIDLHINSLLDTVMGLSNADILEYQLNEFHKVLKENAENKGKKIVFIHGIGNGTLKQKIQQELKHKYKKYYQQDASFKEYGWGAIMITIK